MDMPRICPDFSSETEHVECNIALPMLSEAWPLLILCECDQQQATAIRKVLGLHQLGPILGSHNIYLRGYHTITAASLPCNLQTCFGDICIYLLHSQIDTNMQLRNHKLHFKLRNIPTELGGTIYVWRSAMGSVTWGSHLTNLLEVTCHVCVLNHLTKQQSDILTVLGIIALYTRALRSERTKNSLHWKLCVALFLCWFSNIWQKQPM